MSRQSKKPYANSRLVTFLERRIYELRFRKSQLEIAHEAGFLHANMVANLKMGTSKLPLDRVPGLAKALECDPAHLFMMAIEQMGNGATTEVAIRKIFGTVVTENEVAWLDEIRSASDSADPHLTAKGRAAIRAVFNK